MTRPSRRLPALATVAVLALGAVGGLAACGSGHSGTAPAAVPTGAAATKAATRPCGYATAPPRRFSHVVWIWMENHGTSQVIGARGSTAAKRAPYVNGTLARYCGLETGYHAVTHPSLPNYLAATSGSTHAITSDCGPTRCAVAGPSVFSQIAATGRSWRTYAESMPAPCSRTNSGRYATRHNPAVYYRSLASTCAARDVAFGSATSGRFVSDVRNDRLRAFTFVEPDLCHDTHDCSIRTGDDWLASVLPTLFNSTAYKQGRTAVFLVWDEGEGGTHGQACATSTKASCRMPMLVMSRSVPSGRRVGTTVSHYSLLRTTEAMLGLTPHLGRAATAPDLRASFGLK